MVRPELMSASSAPSARPLKSCETKLPQVIMMRTQPRAAQRRPRSPPPDVVLGIVAELTSECIGLLHERRSGDDLHDRPEVFLVLHLGLFLALHDDHGTHELVVLLAEVHFPHRRLQFAPFLVRL